MSTSASTSASALSSSNRPTSSTSMSPTTASTTAAPPSQTSSASSDPPTPSSSTSSPTSSVKPTTTTSTAIQLPTSDASPTTSPTPTSTSTADTPSSTTSLSSPSESPSPVGTNVPLTTVLESTTVFVTSTNSQGNVVTTVPAVVTEVITTTGTGGVATTVTQAVVNPTLSSNNSATEGSSFFSDTGAVVGVFTVVGLAAASILLWILFAIRRHQRMRRIEQDSVVEAAVAAAGFNRAPLDDDDSPISPNTQRQYSSQMNQRTGHFSSARSGSLPTSVRLLDMLDDSAMDSSTSHTGPTDHRTNSRPDAYTSTSTSTAHRTGQFSDDLGSSRDRRSSYGHTPTYSAGSFEPLLANYAQNLSDREPPAVSPPPNRSVQRLVGGVGPNGYSSDESRVSLKRQNSSDSSVLQDEDDDARYVLMVRNVPDDHSQHSS